MPLQFIGELTNLKDDHGRSVTGSVWLLLDTGGQVRWVTSGAESPARGVPGAFPPAARPTALPGEIQAVLVGELAAERATDKPVVPGQGGPP